MAFLPSILEVYKHLKTHCQVVEQQEKCLGFFNMCINETYLRNFEVNHKYPMQNMPRAAHRQHDNNICFIHLLRPYILSFLLVLKMEYEHLMK